MQQKWVVAVVPEDGSEKPEDFKVTANSPDEALAMALQLMLRQDRAEALQEVLWDFEGVFIGT